MIVTIGKRKEDLMKQVLAAYTRILPVRVTA